MRPWTLAILLLACSGDDGKETTTPDTGTPADTDTDTDADTDADTDTDTDTDTDLTGDTADSSTTADTGALPQVECLDHLADCTSELTTSQVSRGGKRPVSMTYDAYTSCGLLAQSDEDSDADGVIDLSTSYTYDSSDWLTDVALTITIPGYGTVSSSFSYTYNPDGTIAELSYDFDGDGVADSVTTYTYDSQGRVLTATAVTAKTTQYTTFTHTGDEEVGSIAYDIGDDGTIEYYSEYEYTSTQGEIWVDLDDDGIWDEYRLVTYDADGNVLTDSFDSDGDGSFDQVTSYAYTAEGRRDSGTIDADGDGTVDQQLDWVWTCP